VQAMGGKRWDTSSLIQRLRKFRWLRWRSQKKAEFPGNSAFL